MKNVSLKTWTEEPTRKT